MDAIEESEDESDDGSKEEPDDESDQDPDREENIEISDDENIPCIEIPSDDEERFLNHFQDVSQICCQIHLSLSNTFHILPSNCINSSVIKVSNHSNEITRNTCAKKRNPKMAQFEKYVDRRLKMNLVHGCRQAHRIDHQIVCHFRILTIVKQLPLIMAEKDLHW